MEQHKFLRMNHYSDRIIKCNGWQLSILIIGGVILIALPTAMLAHRKGFHEGVEAGIIKTHMIIDQAIAEGEPFTFYKGDVAIVATIKTDSKQFRKEIRKRAEQYELIKYRAMQEIDEDQIKF